MLDIVALGELLIDFTPAGQSANGMRLFEQNPGGAPANVLCAAANMGLNTAFIGKVGADMHGDFLRDVLNRKNVDTSGLISDPDAFTTLAFVALSGTGERSFSFARKPGADTCLRVDELNTALIKSCKIFHFGSLSLTGEPSRSATLAAVELAKRAGAVISYDPNYRASLWAREDEAVAQMRSVLNLVDIIKISEEETELLTGCQSAEKAAEILLGHGAGCAVVTLGKDGAYAASGSGNVMSKAPDARVVDTTGAGDAFWGSFLYMLARSGLRPRNLNREHLLEFSKFANASATICVQRRGAIPALPTLDETLDFLNHNEGKGF